MSLRLALKASLKEPPTGVPAPIPPSKCQRRVDSHLSNRGTASRCVCKRKKATSGLPSYELKPDGMSGTELLDHAISYCLREYANKKDQVRHYIMLIDPTQRNITQ